jgi:hypothetical protein
LPLILSTLQSEEAAKVLDVGTYISHDLRFLHSSGIPLPSLYGLDVISFANLGWELFNDRDRFDVKNRLIVGVILDFYTDNEAAKMLDEEMKVVWRSAVLYQFTWDQGVEACKRFVRLTRGAGSLVMGCQVVSRYEGDGLDMREITKGKAEVETRLFKHNVRSIERMWRCVGEELGIALEVSAT